MRIRRCVSIGLLPRPQKRFQFRYGLRMSLVVGQVAMLLWVSVVVIQLDALFSVIPFRVAPAFCADAAAHEFGALLAAAASHLCVSALLAGCSRIIQELLQARAFEVFWRRNAAHVGERWIDIDQLG